MPKPWKGVPIMSPLCSETSQKPPSIRSVSVPLDRIQSWSAPIRKLTVVSHVPSNRFRKSCSFWGFGISCLVPTAAHVKPAARASAATAPNVLFMAPPGLSIFRDPDLLPVRHVALDDGPLPSLQAAPDLDPVLALRAGLDLAGARPRPFHDEY